MRVQAQDKLPHEEDTFLVACLKKIEDGPLRLYVNEGQRVSALDNREWIVVQYDDKGVPEKMGTIRPNAVRDAIAEYAVMHGFTWPGRKRPGAEETLLVYVRTELFHRDLIAGIIRRAIGWET